MPGPALKQRAATGGPTRMTIQDLVSEPLSRNNISRQGQGSSTVSNSRRQVLFLAAAEKHRLTVSLIDSPRRSRAVVRARWEIMAALRAAGFSYPAIARTFKGRRKSGAMDHSTIIHGVRRHHELAASQ